MTVYSNFYYYKCTQVRMRELYKLLTVRELWLISYDKQHILASHPMPHFIWKQCIMKTLLLWGVFRGEIMVALLVQDWSIHSQSYEWRLTSYCDTYIPRGQQVCSLANMGCELRTFLRKFMIYDVPTPSLGQVWVSFYFFLVNTGAGLWYHRSSSPMQISL